MRWKKQKKVIPAALALLLVQSSLSGVVAGATSGSPTVLENNPVIVPENVLASTYSPAPVWGHFADTYKNNLPAGMTIESNPAIGVLTPFLELWQPGTSWDNGTKLNEGVLDRNIQLVADIAKTRTPDEEALAYYDDRIHQSYGVISGLGSLADVYKAKAGAFTTITSIPEDATTKGYNDSGNGAGKLDSELGDMVRLVNTLRGNYSSSNQAKNFYHYKRPFRWLNDNSVVVPTLVPRISTTPATDGGFPSGHTNASYLAGLALAYAVPERFQELLTRASEMGHSRIVAGMHSPFDVMGGRVLATALGGSILSDPDNAAVKQAAYLNARSVLLAETGTAEDRFSDYQKNKQLYTERLTYGFSQIGSTTEPAVVPKGAEAILETRLPYLTAEQRRAVLATTALPSGYPALDDPEGWGRLNLFAAADGYGAFSSDVTVTMDEAKGGFHAADRWRNDISGNGQLTKEGTGTLRLEGNNTYSGGTLVNGGTLEGHSKTAFGTGDVAIAGGALAEHVSGTVSIGGDLSQSANGKLSLSLGTAGDVLEVGGKAALSGTLELNFAEQYVPSGVITLITHEKNGRTGQFASVTVAGLPSDYQLKVIYQEDRVQLALMSEPPVWGYFADTYKNNVPAGTTIAGNPAIGVLTPFLELWQPGTSWDNGTKLNEGVLDRNIQLVVDIAKTRTPDEEALAYYDDRIHQSYGVISGLGSLADVYKAKAGAFTTITSIPEDATIKGYNDSGNGAGKLDSELGDMVKLVNTLRGNYSSSNQAKNFYHYKRPFRWLNDNSVVVPTLVPRISTTPATDGGFPSGHTNASYLAGLALAYAVPERFQELLTRASEMGHSRIVAGMHSPFDVMGGRVLATALGGAILSDPDNAAVKQAAYKNAREVLLTETGTAEDRFSDYQKNKQLYTERLTYGFSQIGSTTEPAVVPKGAEVLLETRLPYLTAEQRRAVLATTALPSGYPALDDPEGWGRLNLFAAADGYGAFSSDVTVTMDASKGSFHAADRWRNDITGVGKLTKEGTGTLRLEGNNTYSGGTLVNGGTLEGHSKTAFGTGDVAIAGGALAEHVSGKVSISGDLTQSANGKLELTLGSASDVLEVDGKAAVGGTLVLNFTNNYVPANGLITLITHEKNGRTGQFASVQTTGLPNGYKVKVIYQEDRIQLAVDSEAPKWGLNASLTGTSVTPTSITLKWPAASDNVEVVSYNVYQNNNVITTVYGSSTLSYNVTGLSPSTSYTFAIVATDLAGHMSTRLEAKLQTSSNTVNSYYPVTTPVKEETKETLDKGTLTVTTKPGANGAAEANIQDKLIQDLLAQLPATGVAEIIVQAGDATAVSIVLSKEAINSISGSKAKEVKLVTPMGSVTLSQSILDTLRKTSGESVSIVVSKVDTASIPNEVKDRIGSRPVVDITIKSGTTNITTFGGARVKVEIPYTSTAGEDTNALVVYYIAPNGTSVPMIGSSYDREKGMVSFTTDHLSTYAVGYHPVSFSDTQNHWGSSYITFLAARHIVAGQGTGKFAPDAGVTRAEFVKMLAVAANANLAPYGSSSFVDVKAHDWYAPYVAWAAANNIVLGDGNNSFKPNAPISREEISVIMFRFAGTLGIKLQQTVAAKSFDDGASISSWARDAVLALSEAGILSGRENNKFDPQGGATRAEAAKIVAELLQRSMK